MNLDRVEALAERAAGTGAALIATPENTTFLGSAAQKVAIAEPLDGRTNHRLSTLARKLRVHLLIGSVAERCDDTRCYNTSLLFGPNGDLLAKYRKLHLFDIDLPWIEDGTRMFGSAEVRQRFFDLSKAELERRGVHWALVGGVGEARFEAALAVIDAAGLG